MTRLSPQNHDDDRAVHPPGHPPPDDPIPPPEAAFTAFTAASSFGISILQHIYQAKLSKADLTSYGYDATRARHLVTAAETF